MIFKSLLCALFLCANISFAKTKKIYIKDWMYGFKTEKEAFEWCRMLIKDWGGGECEITVDKEPIAGIYRYSVVFYLVM